jgi:hypothetical protein
MYPKNSYENWSKPMRTTKIVEIATFIFLCQLVFAVAASGQERYFEFAFRNQPSSENFITATSDSSVTLLVEHQLALPEKDRTMHISGPIASGNGGHNKNWSWHFTPDKWTLAEMSVELCDGISSHVEADLSYWLNTVGSFCPWNSYVLKEISSLIPGDVDGNNLIDIKDAIAALKMLTETETSPVNKRADVNKDNKIGIEEAVFALQFVAGFVSGLTGEQQSDLEQAANVSALEMDDIQKTAEKLEQLYDVLNYTGLNNVQGQIRSWEQDIQKIISNLLNGEFPCGTIEREGLASVLFAFSGNPDCAGVTGKVKITPYLFAGDVFYNVEYADVTKGDCSINGKATVKISHEKSQITARGTFDDMTICGQNFSGTAVVLNDLEGKELSVRGESQDTYSTGGPEITVKAEYSYSQTEGITGTALMTKGEDTCDCQFENVKIDSECKLPTSGSLTVNGIQMSFSETSCDNPVVAGAINGFTFNISLEEAKNILNIRGPIPRNAALKSVGKCEEVLDDLKQQAIEEMEKAVNENLKNAIEWGGCRWPKYYWAEYDSAGSVNAESSPSPSEQGASQYSETNTQVAGVDEADFVKNDGSYIYILAHGKFNIIKAWPPEESSLISSFQIEGDPKRMFVHNKRAFVYSSLDFTKYDEYGYPYYFQGPDKECTYGYDCDFIGDGRKLKIAVLDISDMEEPALIREIYFSGSYLNSRRIESAVHSVIVFPEPGIGGIEYWPEELQCQTYGRDAYSRPDTEYTEEELTAMFEALKQTNRKTILGSDISDWLPSIKDIRYVDGKPQTTEGILGDCADYYVSWQEDGRHFVSVASLDMDGENAVHSTTIVGRPGAVYASHSSIYIASRHQEYGGMFWFYAPEAKIQEASTVHKFTLINEPPSSAYKGSGVVKGKVLNQFSMDEYVGFFRIATTTGHLPGPDVHSTISILKDNGKRLDVAGQIDGIAPSEDIRSARFDGDRGFIVTFKKTDPLFVFDLSDPYNPSTAGELKIPGYSTYMHRMDDSHLLTIGYDTEAMGDFAWFQGIMLQIFDVSEKKSPGLLYKEVIGTRGSTSDAATNHLAFNYFQPKELLAIPIVICEGGSGGGSYGNIMTFSGLMVYKVTTDAGFEYLGGVSHEAPETEYGGACSNWWTNSNSKVKRSIFMDDYVFSITEDEIKANLVSNLGNDIAVIALKQ